MVDRTIFAEMIRNIDRRQVTDRHFFRTGVEGNFSAQVRAVDNSCVVLWRPNVGRILESNPGVARFEQRFNHSLPQGQQTNLALKNLALLAKRLVVEVPLLKSPAIELRQVRRL